MSQIRDSLRHAAPAAATRVENPLIPLAVFCDGTWCGRETGTFSNIQLLAEMVGEIDFTPKPDEPSQRRATRVNTISPFWGFQGGHKGKMAEANAAPPLLPIAGYQEGVGLNKTFLEYVWDGATASTIAEECTSVYKFIVEHFSPEKEIWMFGLSRGAYTARCVAGMINNCGIINVKSQPGLSDEDIWTLCYEVYRTYRSPLEVDQPGSERSATFRNNPRHVWQVKRPIKFLGLFDTVGSLGIPRLNAGVGFDWPEFYDQKISSVVQHVYHAVSLHDRLWMFQPCLAFEGDGPDKAQIHQKWFPGCHYDLGRQAFRFLRQGPQSQLEKYIGVLPGQLSKTIVPNEVLSDCVLRWMLQSISEHDPWGLLIPNINEKFRNFDARLMHPSDHGVSTGSGDVYDNILDYAPAGSLLSLVQKFGSHAVEGLNEIWPKIGENIQGLLGLKVLLRILAATADRRIPGGRADVFNYKEKEKLGDIELNVMTLAKILEYNDKGKARYPSRTLENWQLWRRTFGVHPVPATAIDLQVVDVGNDPKRRRVLEDDTFNPKTGGLSSEEEKNKYTVPEGFVRGPSPLSQYDEAETGTEKMVRKPEEPLQNTIRREEPRESKLEAMMEVFDVKGVNVDVFEQALHRVLGQHRDGKSLRNS